MIEKSTNSFRMFLSTVIEKYDVAMIRRSPLVQKIWNTWTQKRAQAIIDEYLTHCNTPDELVAYIAANNPMNRFCQINDKGYVKKEVANFAPIIEFLGSDFSGESALDIGQGFGVSLDLMRNAGATDTAFIDIDPAFYAYNTLKGHHGYFINYIKGNGLEAVPENSYDCILSRGSINADQFNRHEQGIISIKKFLDIIEKIWTGKNVILINPTFDRGVTPGQNYWCRNKKEFLKSEFAIELTNRGFTTVYIKRFNHPNYHPVTFIKRPS